MSPTVLVIEPFTDLRLEIAAALRREHYTCDAVATAAEGTVEMDAHPYEYVVVDLESTGDFASTVDPSSHVILLTDEDSRDVGGYPTLRKPFSRDELTLVLSRA